MLATRPTNSPCLSGLTLERILDSAPLSCQPSPQTMDQALNLVTRGHCPEKPSDRRATTSPENICNDDRIRALKMGTASDPLFKGRESVAAWYMPAVLEAE
jgi:hypothetical protein